QKTNFNFEILIHDDASTDGTPDIIREYERKYPGLIKPICQTKNQYTQGINPGRINSDRAVGKYIAYCEGDDYWTDPLKLQKQVDFLENHPEYGLVCTGARKYYQAKNVFKNREYLKPADITYESLIVWNRRIRKTVDMVTLTVCYRKELRRIIDDTFCEKLDPGKYFTGDWALFLRMTIISGIRFLPDVTGVYRVLDESITHSKTNRQRIILFNGQCSRTILYFLENYPIQNERVMHRLRFRHTLTVCKSLMISRDFDSLRTIHIPFYRSIKRLPSFVICSLCKYRPFFDLFSALLYPHKQGTAF
ncbi:MAG: glycosyltransferase, partial [Proteiniphilum sp.]|nr:glycosyltransferase [Proteiniphilum sp.]